MSFREYMNPQNAIQNLGWKSSFLVYLCLSSDSKKSMVPSTNRLSKILHSSRELSHYHETHWCTQKPQSPK